uniref:Ig-like domain-containing protein n=1 Tax=Erpetoichthys calabaricus TaxID=27687 RepID=A0A8C4RP41_ERPCA
ASPTAPTLFPLISTCGSVESNPISIGCLATGFTPSSLQFSWADDKKDLTDFRQFPSVRGNGETYIMSTQLSVATADWDRGANFTCKAKHSAGNREKTLRKPGKMIQFKPDGYGDLVCIASNLNPDDSITFVWSNNTDNDLEIITVDPELTDSIYTARSTYRIGFNEWKSRNKYECKVIDHSYLPFPIQTLTSSFHFLCTVSNINEPILKIMRPPEYDLTEVCLINSFYPPDIFVQWKWNNSLISSSNYSNSEVTAVENMDGSVTYSMYSKLQVEKTHWGVGSCSCIVGHESENQLISETITNVFGEYGFIFRRHCLAFL